MNSQPLDFDKVAASWDQEPRRVRLAQDVAQAIATEITLTPRMEALDFGCGTGLLTLALQPKVGFITGADTSRGMLEVLESKASAQGLSNVRTLLLRQDQELALAGPYDLIVSNMALHHIPKIQPVLASLVAALKPGGSLCLSDLDLEGGQFHGDDRGVYHNGFERAWLGGEFSRAGLVQVRDRTAATMNKPARDGASCDFTIFLLSGLRPA